jgi:hypothetical protein
LALGFRIIISPGIIENKGWLLMENVPRKNRECAPVFNFNHAIVVSCWVCHVVWDGAIELERPLTGARSLLLGHWLRRLYRKLIMWKEVYIQVYTRMETPTHWST